MEVTEAFSAGSSSDAASPGSSRRGGDKDVHMKTMAASSSSTQEATWLTPAGENPASSSPPSVSAQPTPVLASTSQAQAEPASKNVHLHPSEGNVQPGLRASPPILANVTAIDAGSHLPTPLGRIYLDPPSWPLQDREEATLLQHFIDQVSLFVSEPARWLAENQPV